MIRDDINEILRNAGLGDKYKCKKAFVDGSVDRDIDAESNVIYSNDTPKFDCGWVNWKTKSTEFVLSQES